MCIKCSKCEWWAYKCDNNGKMNIKSHARNLRLNM